MAIWLRNGQVPCANNVMNTEDVPSNYFFNIIQIKHALRPFLRGVNGIFSALTKARKEQRTRFVQGLLKRTIHWCPCGLVHKMPCLATKVQRRTDETRLTNAERVRGI